MIRDYRRALGSVHEFWGDEPVMLDGLATGGFSGFIFFVMPRPFKSCRILVDGFVLSQEAASSGLRQDIVGGGFTGHYVTLALKSGDAVVELTAFCIVDKFGKDPASCEPNNDCWF